MTEFVVCVIKYETAFTWVRVSAESAEQARDFAYDWGMEAGDTIGYGDAERSLWEVADAGVQDDETLALDEYIREYKWFDGVTVNSTHPGRGV